jgi:uncharacterized protein with GYD domain
MPIYLWQASYTAEGTKGLLKEGGTRRKQVISQMVEKGGGKLQAYYYAFGETDAYAIIEFPDHATALAFSMSVNAAGAVQVRSTLLLQPEEVDAATKKTIAYTPPGG